MPSKALLQLNMPVSLKRTIIFLVLKMRLFLLCCAFLTVAANLTLSSPYSIVEHLTDGIAITVASLL